MWSNPRDDHGEDHREAEQQGATMQTMLNRRVERFATTELRAIADIVRSIGYPAGSPYSSHVTFPNGGQGSADSPYVMPVVSLPQGDPPCTNPTFLHEKAALEAEIARLIARVRDVRPAPQNKSHASLQGGGQDNNTAVATTGAAAAPAAPTGPSFPQFVDLPSELRRQIWKWALRAECRGRVVIVDVFTRRVLTTPGLKPRVPRACWESRYVAKKFHFVQIPVYRVSGRGRLDTDRLRAGFRRAFIHDEDKYNLLKFGGRVREEQSDCGVKVEIGPSGCIAINSTWDTFIWGPRWEPCKSQESTGKKRDSSSSGRSGGGDSSHSSNTRAEQEHEPVYFKYATMAVNDDHLAHAVFNMTPPENVFGITNIGRTPRHPRLAFARSMIASAMHQSSSSSSAAAAAAVDAAVDANVNANANAAAAAALHPGNKTPYNTPRSSRSMSESPPMPPQLNRATHMSYPPDPSFTMLSLQEAEPLSREAPELRAARSLFGPNRVDYCFRLDLARGRGADNREVLRALVDTEKDGDGDGRGGFNGAGTGAGAVEGRDRAIARLGRLCYHIPGVKAVGQGWALKPPVEARLVRTVQELDL